MYSVTLSFGSRRAGALAVLVHLLLGPSAFAQPSASATIAVTVTSDGAPVPHAEVRAGDALVITDDQGRATVDVAAGIIVLDVQRFGFDGTRMELTLAAGEHRELAVTLEPRSEVEEDVVVTATRTNTRVQDSPVRIETLDREEIEEKLLMTPGDIAMLMNETGGLRVQVTSPSLGAANVRVQGLQGRYTQILADGLPLYGGQTGGLGLLQIPPMDLGQVEVLKGAASAFYGPSALGGVVNLVSRRPPRDEHEREVLLNQTTRGGTDAVLWLAGPMGGSRWGYTLLGGAHRQTQHDIDGDGWADMPGYQRGVLRPRFFWDNRAGRSLFVTTGVMLEDREGGTLDGGTLPTGQPYPEQLRTRRFDAGVTGRFLLPNSTVLSVRGSAMTQSHRHVFGSVLERDRHQTWFGEASLTGARARHTWVIGAAGQLDAYHARDVAGFDYNYASPAVFVQDDYALRPNVVLSGSARLDWHNEFGWFFNPRVSALLRAATGWTTRVSYGTGYFAPTPFTDDTEAVGLSRVLPLAGVAVERGQSASFDVGRRVGLLEVNATLFASRISDPLHSVAEGDHIRLVNADHPTTAWGTDVVVRARWRLLAATTTYTFTDASDVEPDVGARRAVPLTPRHAAGLVVAVEREGRGRVGFEAYYTGRQRLDDNPFRDTSAPFAYIGALAERRFGRLRVFINFENLTDVRQTRFDPLVRPTPGLGGRWTVDAWAPLEGRTVNGGVRLAF